MTTLNPLTVNSSVSPRKNNVQLLNITGGGGGGVIKEMSASLLKTLLGGDNAKYPVILDFSKGYLLANDYFVASCPDIIKEINLSHNQITECNSLSHLSKLKHLFLDNNKVSDISFEGLVSLKILSLMGNELEYLTSMSDLDKLEHLNLSGNKLTAGFHELAKLKSLLSLNLSNNNFNFTLRKFYSFLLLPLKKHTKLQSLAIGRGNPGANNIPNFRLWVIHELPQLKILDERPVEKSEVEEAARLEATGQWADKDGDRLEKKGNWTAPAESTTRVVAPHLNIGTAPAPEEPAAAQPRVVKRADHLNVGGGGDDVSASGSPSMTSAAPSSDTPKVVVRRPDLNVTIGDSSEDEGSSHGSGRKKKEKEKKDKGKKEKKGSGIKTTTVLGKKSSGNGGAVRSRAGSETDDRDKWPTDPSILAKIASSLPVPAAAAGQARPPSTDLTQGATAQRLSQQLTASQTQFVGGAQQQHQQPKQEEEGSLETRIDYLRSFFLLDELSHTLCLFAQAAATPVWGATEFLHLNNQLKQLVVHTKVMYERVQQFLARYPFEEKRITDATVVVQNNIRGLVISVKQLNEAQARGGTVATAISAAKELALAMFRMFNIVEEGAIPSTDETAADIQECARGVMKLIQIATGMSRELHIDQYSELLLQQSERLSHQLNIKIPTLQNPEVQRRAAASTGSINGSITKLIALSKQYQADPSPLLLQEIRHTAQTIATEFQSINSMVHTSRFASPLSPYDERVMYETSHQLLVEENNFVGIHEDAMLPNERQVLTHMKTMMQLAGEIKAVVSLKPVSTPHLMQLVLDMSSVGAATCHQLYVTAANYADRATREQLERYGRAIRYYSFLERIALCSLILNFAAPDVLHLSTSMKGQAFCTSNAIKMILLSALTQAPQLSGPKRHSGVNFDDLLSMLQ